MAGPEPPPPLIAAIQAGELARVRELLDAGADPNSGVPYQEGGAAPANIPALYFACVADAPEIVELLLQRGAETQDGESIYHAAQLNRIRCLEVLLAHGADLSSRQSPYGNTPLYFLVGHHDEEGGKAAWHQGLLWLLEHGADANVTSYEKREAPLHAVAAAYPPKPATARALIDHGADVNLARADGRTPYPLACRCGNTATADLLRQHGARTTPIAAVDEFLAACLAADEPAAHAILSANPGLMAEMRPEERLGLTWAVCLEREPAVRLMVKLGFDPSFQHHDGTPLHDAGWHGLMAMVKLLRELGAAINKRDARFGCSPLGWAAHGSGCHSGRDATYCTIIDELIAAGAMHEAACNRWSGTPESMASPAVAEHLRLRFRGGIVPS